MLNTPTVPAPETDRVIVLTPKGTAVRAAYRFLATLRALGADDHAAVLEMLSLELAELPTDGGLPARFVSLADTYQVP